MDSQTPPNSSQPAVPSSKYTYRQLNLLSSSSPAKESPLRVISLCDLDCFYAQVEGVRIKADPDEPLAVSQWGGLIAIVSALSSFAYEARLTTLELRCKVLQYSSSDHGCD